MEWFLVLDLLVLLVEGVMLKESEGSLSVRSHLKLGEICQNSLFRKSSVDKPSAPGQNRQQRFSYMNQNTPAKLSAMQKLRQ